MQKKSQTRKNVTIREVASHAGVSPKTVSNFINDWPYMTDETRQKVEDAINQLGYRPSGLATSLRTGRTNIVGVVVQDITSQFFGQVIRGCGDALYQHGYNMMLCAANEDLEKEQKYLEMLVNRGVDGLILYGCRSSKEAIVSIVGENLPIVADNSSVWLPNMTVIQIDNVAGARIATQHLIDQGFRNIGFLDGPSQRFATATRLEGYREALESAGIPFNPDLVNNSSPSIKGGYEAAMKLLPAQKPQALFCFNDLMALGAYIACEELHLHVSKDIAIIGFDDIADASLVEPLLTTIRVDQYKYGQLAGEHMVKRMINSNLSQEFVDVSVSLVVRHSCGEKRLSHRQKIQMYRDLLERGLVGMEVPEETLEG